VVEGEGGSKRGFTRVLRIEIGMINVTSLPGVPGEHDDLIMSGLISSDAKILGQITYDDPGMVTFPIRSWTF